MNNNSHRNQIQSLSSLSLEHNLRNLTDSQFFPNNPRKSSFDLVNLLNQSRHGCQQRSKVEKSLDMLNSSFNIYKINQSPPQNFLQYTDDDRSKLSRAGIHCADIDPIDSQNDSYQPEPPPSPQQVPEQKRLGPSETTSIECFPPELARLLYEKQIPWQYVRGLLRVGDQKEIKSLRRLKVQRYLEKRRKKTWDKKICYNCRQKVAEQRLRIKGKFIKKRRAMQILGLAIPISTSQIKERLEYMLRDKTLKEVEEIIHRDEED